MLDKVYEFIRKNNMISPGDSVVAGVSGGADSVCLLILLHKIRSRYGDELPFSLSCVHIQHGIRYDAAQDEAFTSCLCRKLGVGMTAFEADVTEMAASAGTSLEETARDLRYSCLDHISEKEIRVADDGTSVKIALAHHGDDRAETILFNLFRGTGLTGAAGIRPVRDNIIRPLLCLTRDEIEEYLVNEGQDWCVDYTNDDTAYARNRIRHIILPQAKEHISAGAVANLNRAGDIMAMADEYISGQAYELYKKCMPEETGEIGKEGRQIRIKLEYLKQAPEILVRYAVMSMLSGVTGHWKDIGSIHVEQVMRLFLTGRNRVIHLPDGIKAAVEYDYGRMYVGEPAWEQRDGIFIFPPGIPEMHIFKYTNAMDISRKKYTKWFDYDKIENQPEFRTRRPGDYLMVDGDSAALHKKSIKKYMIDEKIPLSLRDRICLLADGSHIMWIPGYRISAWYKVGQSTENAVEISGDPLALDFEGDEENA